MSNDIAFALNYTNYYEIDVTPTGSSRTWERVGAGINSVSWGGNEVSSQDPYYDGEGLASTDVTGGQMIGAFSGHRKYGDPAQDFIAGMMLNYGSGRNTNFRWTAPDGQVLEGPCTIANITPQSGDPNAKSDFGFEVHFNGRPTFTAGDKTSFPTSITAQAVSVVKDGTAPVDATVTPNTASDKFSYAIDNEEYATVSSDGIVTGLKATGTGQSAADVNLTIKSVVLPSVSTQVKVTVTAS